MMSLEEIADVASHYEEWREAEDPGSAGALQARLIFRAACKKAYEAESEEMRAKWTFEDYVATFVTPEINRYLNQRISKFPTVQPEK